MTFLEILVLIIVIALSIIVVRISFKFDINRFLENRRKIKIDQLKNICPHMKISSDNGNNFSMQSFFSSPFGTLMWACSQCGLIVGSEEDVNRLMEPYKNNLKSYLKRQKEFIKKAKKLNIL